MGTRARTFGAPLIGAVALLAIAATPAAAAPGTAFNRPLQLPGGAGASATALSVEPGGDAYVAGSTGAGTGCVLVQVSHGGATAHFMGRTAGGLDCSIAATPGGAALATTTTQGLIAGTTGTTRPRQRWSGALAGTTALPALATDPAPPPGQTAATFLLVRGADGLPHVAVSTDGGVTYAPGPSLVDPIDMPATLWQGAGPMPLAGNLVARRDAAGLTLYAVLATADGAADRAAQAKAGTDRLDRIWAAVGVVTPGATPGAAPAIAWHDAEVFHGTPDVALNRPAPQVAVDSAGQVYVTFADGRHVYVKQDPTGLLWNPGAAPVALDATVPGLPDGVDASAVPAIAAGGNGDVDLAWYSAGGGDRRLADPSTDPHDSWAVVVAQSLDGGATWLTYLASGPLPVHQGALDPAAALQLAIDQATGAAVLAYTGDPVQPGLPSLFATRQCTGFSAVTGRALVDDCVASQPATPVLPGTTCPGPQVTDPANDAIDTSSGGSGANLPSLDLLSLGFGTANNGDQVATVTVNSMSTALPTDVTQAWWDVTWTQGAVQRYAQLTIPAGGAPAFTTGTVNSDGSLAPGTSITGAITPGANGGFAMTLPLSAIGSPAANTLLTGVSVTSYARFVGQTLSAPQLVDRAPDAGTGADYGIAQTCDPSTDLPEVPAAVLVPVVGGIVGLFILWQRRRRPRSPEP